MMYPVPVAIRRSAVVLAGLLQFSLSTGSHAMQGRISMDVGSDYSSGDYGLATETEVRYSYLRTGYENGPWLMQLTVPYIELTAEDDVTLGPSGPMSSLDPSSFMFFPPPSSSTTSERSTRSGLGDVILSLGYGFSWPRSQRLFYELTAKAKLATADEDKGLGTGENDYSMQFDAMSRLGRFDFFAGVGYRLLGDTETVEFNNTVFANAGAAWRAVGTLSLGFVYDYAEAATAYTDEQRTVSPYVAWELSEDFDVSVSALKGFTDASPESGYGMQLRVIF